MTIVERIDAPAAGAVISGTGAAEAPLASLPDRPFVGLGGRAAWRARRIVPTMPEQGDRAPWWHTHRSEDDLRPPRHVRVPAVGS